MMPSVNMRPVLPLTQPTWGRDGGEVERKVSAEQTAPSAKKADSERNHDRVKNKL